MSIPSFCVDESLLESGLQFAAVWGRGLTEIKTPETLPAEFTALIERIRTEGRSPWRDGIREAVRNMLRYGRYKPTGRGKPASEFLLGAALEGAFPLLNMPANINNFISLSSGLPISIFDLDVVGDALLIRRGLSEEKYVFNPSGQDIALEDLLCVCRPVDGQWVPTGNPVKDAMVSKITSTTRNVIAVIYAPESVTPAELDERAAVFEALLVDWAGAAETGRRIVARSDR